MIDRRKLLIVRGGANVYPTEVEHVVKTAPGVRDAAVFGRPDDRLSGRCAGELAACKIPDTWARH